MVGILSADVVAAATGGGTHSKTTEKQPASCKERAVSTTYRTPNSTLDTSACNHAQKWIARERRGLE